MDPLTPDQAGKHAERWRLAALRETGELREADMELKLRQLAALVASHHIFPPDLVREREPSATCERWRQLRPALKGRQPGAGAGVGSHNQASVFRLRKVL